MKVYLAAIEGHVPDDVVRTFRAFLEFCYIVRRDVLTERSLAELDDALERFHRYRTIFTTLGVITTLSLPRQHSLAHYKFLIRQFGAPNGLCSSITESKHIKAVKEPWRRSSHFNALKQMLLTNQRLDKLAAIRVEFKARGMLDRNWVFIDEDVLEHTTTIFRILPVDAPSAAFLRVRGLDGGSVEEEEVCTVDKDVEAKVRLAKTRARGRARTVPELAAELELDEIELVYQVQCFIYQQTYPSEDVTSVLFEDLPMFDASTRISVFNSAVATFRAPSDLCGIHGMRKERIRSSLNWRNEASRHDCAFVSTDKDIAGMLGMEVVRVLGFFSFSYATTRYPCVLVQWFSRVRDERDEKTGMYVVRPDLNRDRTRNIAVVHVSSLVRAAHLIPVYGNEPVPETLKHYHSYDVFDEYYVNRYADHHSFEIA